MISVNTPITIEGKQCILMRDLLGDAPNSKYTSQSQNTLQVWYEEEALRETREAHPDTPVYGFWQTLIASGLIDTKKPLQYIFTTETRDFGYYLYSNNSLLHTGSLFNDELQRLPGPAIADGISLADGEEITVDPTELKLPQFPLRTHKERIKAAAESKKKSQQRAFLSISAIVAAGLLADTGLAYQHEEHMEAFKKANTELHIAEQTLDAINKRKLVDWPNQKASLSDLYQISSLLQNSKLSGEITFLPNKSSVIEVSEIPNRNIKLNLLAEKGIEFKLPSANKTLIEWVNDDQ